MSGAYAPASFFGMPLGVLGLGLAWRSAVRLWPLPPLIAEAVLAAGALLWCLLALRYAEKWLRSPDEARAEFEHPVQCCFVGLAPVGASLAGLAVLPYSRALAVASFAVGASGTLAFALYRTGRLWRGGRDVETTTAVLYLPAVAGSFVTATAAGLLGWREWGQLAFGAGLFSWVAIESVLLARLYGGPELALALRPTLGIQLAPPAVGALAYLNVGSGAPDMLVNALLGYALLQALVLARLFRWIAAGPFTASYWGFSFGAAALAGVCIRIGAMGSPIGKLLALPTFVLSNALFVFLAGGTLVLLTTGRLLPSPAASFGGQRPVAGR